MTFQKVRFMFIWEGKVYRGGVRRIREEAAQHVTDLALTFVSHGAYTSMLQHPSISTDNRLYRASTTPFDPILPLAHLLSSEAITPTSLYLLRPYTYFKIDMRKVAQKYCRAGFAQGTMRAAAAYARRKGQMDKRLLNEATGGCEFGSWSLPWQGVRVMLKSKVANALDGSRACNLGSDLIHYRRTKPRKYVNPLHVQIYSHAHRGKTI